MTILSRLFGGTRTEARDVSFEDYFGIGSDQLDYLGPAATGTGGYSMANAAQWACVGLKGDQISTMPYAAFRRGTGGHAEQVRRQPSLLTDPSDYLTPIHWLFAYTASMMLNGNAIGVVTARTPDGLPTKVEWLDSGRVDVTQGDGFQLRYTIDGQAFTSREIVHDRGVVLPGQVKGLSPVGVLRHTFESGNYAQSFGHSFFKAGGRPSGILSSPEIVTAEQAANIKTRYTATLKAGEPVVLGNQMTYSPITVNPEDSQFLESQKFSATQIARIHRIPPHMIGAESGSTMTYSNVEADSLHFLTYSLRPDLRRVEALLTSLIPGPQFVKFNPAALLATDLKSRYESYKLGLEAGFLTLQQIWDWEDWGPVPEELTIGRAVAQMEELVQ